jgi:cell division transport system permease protein
VRWASPIAYFWQQAWHQLVRDHRLSVTAILANLATLFVSALFLLVAFNLNEAMRSMRAQRHVQVFLAPATPAIERDRIGTALRALPGVLGATLVTPEEALREFERDFGESGLEEALGENPLPASFRLSLADRARSESALDELQDATRRIVGVESVRYGTPGVLALEAKVRAFAIITVIFGVLVGLSAVLVVANTIRLTILARRDLVEILKLIGARDSFVSMPFLLEGAAQGAISGVGAIVLVWIGQSVLSRRMGGVMFFDWPVVAAFLVFSVAVGGAGAFWATAGPLRDDWRGG